MPATRVALIGYGAWGRHHARAIAAVPDAELTAICTRSPGNAAAARRPTTRGRLYADHREMLGGRTRPVRRRPAVRPALRVAKDVLESGRHLLLEKPMALSSSAAASWSPGRDARARAGGRPRAAAVVAVGQGEGADRRRRDRRAAVRPDRAVAEALPARLRRLAVRHRARRQLDPRGADPLLRPGPVVSGGVGEPVSVYAAPTASAPTIRSCTTTSRRSSTFPGGRYAVISQTLAGVGASSDREAHRHRRGDLGLVERRDGPHVRADFWLKLQRGTRRTKCRSPSRRAKCTSWSTRSRPSSGRCGRGRPCPAPARTAGGRWRCA